MSHMVIYRGIDGKPGYHQTDDIHDAIGFVEQMRNEEGVEHARIFRLEEVVFEYRPYYRVEIAQGAQGPMSLSEAPPSQLVNGEPTAPVGIGVPAPVHNEAAPAIDLVDDVIEVAAGFDDAAAEALEHSEDLVAGGGYEPLDSKITADAGAAKKGLFGR